MIHIPLGSGVILFIDQLHAGHYGKENNIRYHAILADEGWDGSQLLLLEDYNKKHLRMSVEGARYYADTWRDNVSRREIAHDKKDAVKKYDKG